ncbi:hypothetical protein QBC44DRAFT_395343 [Cladorrhinum sp. PSN332]|nr:hypothetical protein QBC44DRAFT_395343 [Cladorrhinum sp. PSN332]
MDQHPSLNPFQFLQFRRQQTYLLGLYRLGRAREYPTLEPLRHWGNIPVPKPGQWLGHQIQNPSIANQFPPDDNFFPKYVRGGGGGGNTAASSAPSGAMPREFVDGLPRVIDTELHNLRFTKVLGWGGLGLAALYAMEDKLAQFKGWIVVKFFLPGAPDFEVEKGNHLLLGRCRHVVQLVPIRRPPKKGRGQESPGKGGVLGGITGGGVKRRAGDGGGVGGTDWTVGMVEAVGGRRPSKRRATAEDNLFVERTQGVDEEMLEDSPSTLFLENMARGSLNTWICKVGQEHKFSDKVLWLMFDCLFKGVIAMAHPPQLAREQEYEQSGGKWGTTHFDEQIPLWNKEARTSDDLVHFDLDPTNILVGDFNVGPDKAHSMIPVLKIADLGLMEEMKDHKKKSAEMMWGVRACGKAYNGWLSPEQFHEEWDYLKNPLPGRETDPRTKPKIAGQYGWRTNVYWLGLVMFNLITRFHPPPRPIPYSMGSEYITDERTGQKRQRDPWTYGGYLMHHRFKGQVDPDLLKTVCYCMTDDPEHRPSLEDLSRKISYKIAQDWPGEDDGATREWARGFFEKPGYAGPEKPKLFRSGPSSIFTGLALHANMDPDEEMEDAFNSFSTQPRGRFPLGPDAPMPPEAPSLDPDIEMFL